MNIQVREQSEDWKKCCEIIDKLIEISDREQLGDCIRMCCANSEEIMNCVIGQYSDVIENDDW